MMMMMVMMGMVPVIIAARCPATTTSVTCVVIRIPDIPAEGRQSERGGAAGMVEASGDQHGVRGARVPGCGVMSMSMSSVGCGGGGVEIRVGGRHDGAHGAAGGLERGRSSA